MAKLLIALFKPLFSQLAVPALAYETSVVGTASGGNAYTFGSQEYTFGGQPYTYGAP